MLQSLPPADTTLLSHHAAWPGQTPTLSTSASSLAAATRSLASLATSGVANNSVQTLSQWRAGVVAALPAITALSSTAASLRTAVTPSLTIASDVATLATYASGVTNVVCSPEIPNVVAVTASLRAALPSTASVSSQLSALVASMAQAGAAVPSLPLLLTTLNSDLATLTSATTTFNTSWAMLQVRRTSGNGDVPPSSGSLYVEGDRVCVLGERVCMVGVAAVV